MGDSPTTATGYSESRLLDVYRSQTTIDPTLQAICAGRGAEFLATGSSSPVVVQSGEAWVDGRHYLSDASTNVAISTPVATRIDRIVLRRDATAKTVRIVALTGTAGGAMASLTQNATTYEVDLWWASITSGGVITLTDKRVFAASPLVRGALDNVTLGWNTTSKKAEIKDGGVTAAKLASGVAVSNLGFTPVRQGGGTGQVADGLNTLYIGKNSSSVNAKITIDATDLGNIITDGASSAALLPLNKLAAQISTAYIANGAVLNAQIGDGEINAVKLASNAVTTAKILDANVTTAKLADGNVTTIKILDANVTTAKLADGSVTAAKIADGNVSTAKLTDANVTTIKIADGNVTAAKLASGVAVSNLGFTPVRQGGGTGQVADGLNTLYIGKNSSSVNAKITIDATDLGNIITDGAFSTATLPTTKLSGTVGNALLSSMTSATVKGQIVGGSGAPVDLTAAQLAAIGLAGGLGNLTITGRQGSSATNWNAAGATSQTVSGVKVLAGTALMDMSSGVNSKTTAITLTGFTNTPLVIVTVERDLNISGGYFVASVDVTSNTAATIYVRSTNGTTTTTSFGVSWIAIGE